MADVNIKPLLMANIGGSKDNVADIKLKQIELEISVKLLQLCVMQKITHDEMNNLLKMLKSNDHENYVVAYETIKELLKTIE